MSEYCTLDEAKSHLRVDNDFEDADITLKIQGASQMVKNYLKSASPWLPEYDSNDDVVLDSNDEPVLYLDSTGQPVPKFEVKIATLILVGILYRDRDGEEMSSWQMGYLPAPVTALLYPIRDPALQ